MSDTLNRDKLGKVLALLTSDHDGEALSAARRAVAMLQAVGMRPEDLAKPQQPPSDSSALRVMVVEMELAAARRRIAELERQLAAGAAESALDAAHARGYQKGLKAGRDEIEREVRLAADRRIREVEAELEAYRQPLDWPDLAERFAHKNQRGANSAHAHGILLRARTNKLTPADQAALRQFAEPPKRGRKAKAPEEAAA